MPVTFYPEPLRFADVIYEKPTLSKYTAYNELRQFLSLGSF